jgi:hypothetical protein
MPEINGVKIENLWDMQKHFGLHCLFDMSRKGYPNYFNSKYYLDSQQIGFSRLITDNSGMIAWSSFYPNGDIRGNEVFPKRKGMGTLAHFATLTALKWIIENIGNSKTFNLQIAHMSSTSYERQKHLAAMGIDYEHGIYDFADYYKRSARYAAKKGILSKIVISDQGPRSLLDDIKSSNKNYEQYFVFQPENLLGCKNCPRSCRLHGIQTEQALDEVLRSQVKGDYSIRKTEFFGDENYATEIHRKEDGRMTATCLCRATGEIMSAYPPLK